MIVDMSKARFELIATLTLGALVALAGSARAVAADPATSDKPGSYRTAMAPPTSGGADRPNWETTADSFGGYRSETRPCKDATMQFTMPTEVRVVNVRAGQRVTKGEILARARDGELRASVDQQKMLAASTLEIEGREKQLELANFRFEQLKKGKNWSPIEFEEAKSAVDTARVQLGLSKLDHEQQQHKLKQYEGQFERTYLEAPFDGIIEEVYIEAGQGVNEQQKALRIVDISKLWLDAYVDTGETIERNLQPGAAAWVLVALPTPVMAQAKVLNVSPVADSVSKSRRVRVEMENVKNWPAGVTAKVRFSEPDAKFAQYKLQTSSAEAVAEDQARQAVEQMHADAEARRPVEAPKRD